VTMELGHNNVLQISDDDVYCLDCQPDNIPSPPNNNNNNNNSITRLNTPKGTSSRLSSTPPAPPAIPTPIEHNNNKSTQDVHQTYDFPFKPPTPRKKISEVDGSQHWPSETNSHHGLDTFCYYDGRCSFCGSSSMVFRKNTKVVKTILCNGRPRFVQSLLLKCRICNKTTMAYDKSYIDTLSHEKKRELNAIISGQSYGIDMSLVRALRNGASADEVEQTARANLYDDWSVCKRQHEESDKQGQDYPPFPEEYVPKAAQLNKAFLRDMESERIWLKRELAALKSSLTLSIDCQVKVVKRCIKKEDGMGGIQALSIVGDFGLVLSHAVVPSDKKEYRTPAMEEVIARHEDDPPKFCYVDKDCCNGKPGGRTEESKMYYRMEKKLDSRHLIARIGDTINQEHKRAAAFMSSLSECIFTSNVIDLGRLGAACEEQEGSFRSLTSRERKCEHIRRHIESEKAICSSIIKKVIYHATIDKDNMAKYEGLQYHDPSKILTPSHWAYPLITIQSWKAIQQQLIHINNGCISDDGNDMHCVQRQKKYKNTDTMLPVYTCNRGTSKNESFHSYVSTKSKEWHQIRPELYDARVLWLVIHYNRKRLRDVGRQALPNGISPSEAATNEVVLAPVVDGEKIKFGFDYFNHVKNMRVKIVMRSAEEFARITTKSSTVINASKHINDYSLLDNIGELSDEVEPKDISRIGEVFEQALPDAAMFHDRIKRIDMTLPTNVIEECTQSLVEHRKGPPVPYVRYPKEGKEIDEDTLTRSTASTLTTNSTIPCSLNMSGDNNLLNRQQIAREIMVKNKISLSRDTKIPGKRDNNCDACCKNRDTFTFNGRRHMQINKAEKGVKLRWYCPLADPPEQYYSLLEKRNELERRRNERKNEKRRARRYK